MEKVTVTIEFTAAVNTDAPVSELEAVAEANGYSWADEDDRDEIVSLWAMKHARPTTTYADYSGDYSQISFGASERRKGQFEVYGEEDADSFKVTWEDQAHGN
jgi:hypothetical protein